MNLSETADTIQAQKDFTKKFLRAVKEASTIGDEQVTDTFKETIQRVVGSLIRDVELGQLWRAGFTHLTDEDYERIRNDALQRIKERNRNMNALL